jgi:predicted O-methyltransferase YrrM
VISKFLYYRPRLEAALSELDKNRLKLPVLSLQRLFPEFNERQVLFDEVPIGPWSTPIADVTMLLTIVVCTRPKRLMEVGSYRGYTALMLAKHLEADARLLTVDFDARHGEAYRNSSHAAKIERRVARVEESAFINDVRGSYDLIFLDADHTYEAVKRDTIVLLELLAEKGYFIWHDFGNLGKLAGKTAFLSFFTNSPKNFRSLRSLAHHLPSIAPLGEPARVRKSSARHCILGSLKAGTRGRLQQVADRSA